MFEKIHFKGTFRPYQKQILDKMKNLMNDGKLHIVAAPGSGKTILGLEVLLRLNKKTLVLAPTITIREQWIERFNTHFYNDENNKIITNELQHPKLITVITYQALHAAYNRLNSVSDENDEEISEYNYENIDLINLLKTEDIKTIVLDEAHHLRSEWWKSLTEVITHLDVTIISLTATPPYDVSISEWEKYKTLCGSIDAEIYVPELVADHNLCPHQDYVYFNYPTEAESQSIRDYRESVNRFVNSLSQNETLIQALKTHRYITTPENYLEEILKTPEYYTSILVFLKHLNISVSESSVRILGKSILPRLSKKHLETLLKYVLFIDNNSYDSQMLKDIKRQLITLGCLERQVIYLENNPKVSKMLISSVGKLTSIKDIVKSELDSLSTELRMVILTDFIRKEVLPKSHDFKPILSIGVVPIFETLRRENIINLRCAVLSGSLIILPKNSVSPLRDLLNKKNIRNYELTDTIDPNYVEFTINGESNKQKVGIVSELFSLGEINVLIGTKSLLGEGWDEVSINSLIIASFVGSYMLSNQMRGRAIRVNKNNGNKTANIWHLVCVERKELYEKDFASFIGTKIEQTILIGKDTLISDDYEMLKLRFRGFVGVAYEENVIENGIERLSYIKPPFTHKNITTINNKMLTKSKEREQLAQQWKEALVESNGQYQMVENVTVDKTIMPRPFILVDSIMILVIQAIIIVVFYSFLIPGGFISSSFIKLFIYIINLACLPFIVTAIRLLLTYGSLKKYFKGINNALLETLKHFELIKSKNALVQVNVKNRVISSCYLDNASTYEKTIFTECLEEIFGIIDNPRYLIERKGLIIKTRDYQSVPTVIGKNKEMAEYYANIWRKHVGPNRLIYTRDIKGRKLLLYARVNSLSFQSLNYFERKQIVKNKWN